MDKDDDFDAVESAFICILISTTILLNLYDVLSECFCRAPPPPRKIPGYGAGVRVKSRVYPYPRVRVRVQRHGYGSGTGSQNGVYPHSPSTCARPLLNSLVDSLRLHHRLRIIKMGVKMTVLLWYSPALTLTPIILFIATFVVNHNPIHKTL